MKIKRVLALLVVLVTLMSPLMSVQAQDDTLKPVSQSIIFIYGSDTQPCEPPTPGKPPLLPLGSGFVVGIPEKGAAQPGLWKAWKFLATAQHVIGNRESVILRLNKKDSSGLVCHRLELSRSGNTQNVFAHKRLEVDLLLISIPDIPDTDPVVFDFSLIADDTVYKTWEVQEGTDVYTIGYLYGYSGQKQNFPVTKFGRVALLTDESWYRSDRPITIPLTQEQRDELKKDTGNLFTEVHTPPGTPEQAYLIELNNTPGLSGAPVMLKSPQFRVTGPAPGQLQFRKVEPLVIGVIKGLLLSPTGSQGLAAIEPARHLKEMLSDLVGELKKAGRNPDIPE